MKKYGALAILLALIVAFAGCSASYSGNAAEPSYGGKIADADRESKTAQSDSFPLAEKDDPDAKIVWTGSVQMQTTDWSKTVDDLSQVFAQYGAEVISAEENSGASYYYGSRANAKRAVYELRVPSETFAEFFDAFSDVNGSVTSAQKSREDMTRAYNDNALKIALLETEYNELKALMEKAGSVEEILAIRDRMTGVLYELESLNKANNQIDYDASWSRVTLTLQEVIVYSEVDADFGQRVKVAFINGWAEFASAMQEIFVFLLAALPWLLLLGGITVLTVLLIRRGNRKRRARRAQQQGNTPR
ncbi:MAG: DUF4349 domain-containing protein [Clostridia bacterium]|nr:DUF4349 domain-containing protein [Clostridia bacterium]